MYIYIHVLFLYLMKYEYYTCMIQFRVDTIKLVSNVNISGKFILLIFYQT